MPELDERQQQAVDAGPRDLFIAAGAGSGKTRVLTARFVAAVLGTPPYEQTEPDALLTVTYTEKAAGELNERMRRGLIDAGRPDAARRVSESWISTIHGMCSRIIRRHALDIGIDPHFTVLDGIESSVVETDVLDKVLGDLIESDPGAAEMVGALSFTTVADALRSARADLLAAGLEVHDLQVIGPEEVDRGLSELAGRASELAEGFAGLRANKTTDANAQAARTLSDLLERVSRDELSADDVLTSATAILFRQLRSVEGHEELVDEARMLIDAARMHAAQRAVARYEDVFKRALERFARAYATEKRARGVLDFEDLQTLTAHMLRQRPDIAERYRRHFAMVMVDEFQDTNALQLGIISSLADGDLCTVGDENQSIYSFRHADVGVFRAHGRSTDVHVELDINYRIAPPLLDAINGLFAHPLLLGEAYMTLRSPTAPQDRPEWPTQLGRFAVRFVDTATGETEPHAAEAAALAECVAEHVALGIEPGDIAVLLGALSRGQGAAVERELAGRGIPAVLAAGGAFFDCVEVHEVRALLRVIDNVRDDHALLTVLAGRITGLGPDALFSIRSEVDAERSERTSERGPSRRLSLWEALQRALHGLPDGGEREAAGRTIAAVDAARSMQGVRPLGETMLQALLDVDYDLTLFTEGRPGIRSWANVMKLVRMADEFEASGSGGLGGFLHSLESRETHSRGEQEATLDAVSGAVRIMSIHAAKGLEFPVVVVGSLSSDSSTPGIALARTDGRMLLGMVLPRADGNDKTLAWRAVADARTAVRDAERRRLFYVACTRAREGLTIVCRTRSDREAGDTIPGILRSAFGMSEPGSLASREVHVGVGTIGVSVVEGTIEDAAADVVAGSDVAAGMVAPAVAKVVEAPTSEAPTTPSVTSVPPVSYTALATYERCPYHYHLVRVARLPLPPSVGATTALDYGSALHLVLQLASDADVLDEVIDRSLRATGVDPTRRPALEKAAKTFLDSRLAGRIRAAERVEHEAPFLVPIASTVLSGAMDLIAWSGSSALIVDYKTGAGPLELREARGRYQLQAECYALAALHAGAESAEVVFAEVERMREITFTYSASDRPALIERVSRPVHAIRRGEFKPLGSYAQGLCDSCPGFGGLCPVTRPEAGASA
ncbi:MAG: UvrD-helicase domain-containing protein [Coriobacteriia bacterium]|nr:UvrD-helicase domain-containing protein [Coriobacteriia bacterium]MBN2841057.1 UvrD-helicase domain-containing protein [Coriobacteriia bacterium]